MHVWPIRNDDTVWGVKVEYIKDQDWTHIKYEFFTDSTDLSEIIRHIESWMELHNYQAISQIQIQLDLK